MENSLSDFPFQVLIAALNEEQGIGPTITEFSKNLRARFLVVDGHSVDRTVEIAKDCGAEVLFQDGKGKGDAILKKGLKHLDASANYVVFTDADYTYPAEYVPQMIKILHDNPEVGMVCGNRFSKQIDDYAFYGSFSLGNQLLAFAHAVFNGVFLADPLTGLRAVRADILRNWVVKSQGFDIEVELNREVERQGFVSLEVPIRYRARLGKKKLRVKDGVTILKRILLEFTYATVEAVESRGKEKSATELAV
jgi:glycosyltransferase involved in cell wall biosynthesis